MKQTLAAALAVIGQEGAELETKALAVLRIVRAQKITNVIDWSRAVREAYKANGWNGKPGKPKAGEGKAAVPATVKQYVSAVRRAFRLKLPVASYTSFYALRQDLRKRAERTAARKPAEKPELAGVRLLRPDTLSGSPFHDLVVVYGALDRKHQTQMLSAVDRLKRQFATAAAPQLVSTALPEELGLRKAA